MPAAFSASIELVGAKAMRSALRLTGKRLRVGPAVGVSTGPLETSKQIYITLHQLLANLNGDRSNERLEQHVARARIRASEKGWALLGIWPRRRNSASRL